MMSPRLSGEVAVSLTNWAKHASGGSEAKMIFYQATLCRSLYAAFIPCTASHQAVNCWWKWWHTMIANIEGYVRYVIQKPFHEKRTGNLRAWVKEFDEAHGAGHGSETVAVKSIRVRMYNVGFGNPPADTSGEAQDTLAGRGLPTFGLTPMRNAGVEFPGVAGLMGVGGSYIKQGKLDEHLLWKVPAAGAFYAGRLEWRTHSGI